MIITIQWKWPLPPAWVGKFLPFFLHWSASWVHTPHNLLLIGTLSRSNTYFFVNNLIWLKGLLCLKAQKVKNAYVEYVITAVRNSISKLWTFYFLLTTSFTQVLGHSWPHQLRHQEDEGPSVLPDPPGLAGQLPHMSPASDWWAEHSVLSWGTRRSHCNIF